MKRNVTYGLYRGEVEMTRIMYQRGELSYSDAMEYLQQLYLLRKVDNDIRHV